MKSAMVPNYPLVKGLLLLGAALLCSSVVPATAQPARPAALRAHAAELEREATELKQAGRHDEGLELMRQAEELRAQVARLRAESGGGPRATAPLVKEREMLVRKLDELRQQGRDDDAAKVKERILAVEREIAELPGRVRSRQLTQGDEAARRPDPAEIERRAHHLEVAIENLHAAGLHEPAEHLTEQLERMRQRLAEMAPRRPDRPEVSRDLIEDIRAQIGELHRAVDQLRADIDELRRERR